MILRVGGWMAPLPCSSMWAVTIKQTPNCLCDRATSECAHWPSSQGDAAEWGNLYIFINNRKYIILLSQCSDIQKILTAMEPQYRVLSLDWPVSLLPQKGSFRLPDTFFLVADILLHLKVGGVPTRAHYFRFFLRTSVNEMQWHTQKYNFV
jgi:hypothetical protein